MIFINIKDFLLYFAINIACLFTCTPVILLRQFTSTDVYLLGGLRKTGCVHKEEARCDGTAQKPIRQTHQF